MGLFNPNIPQPADKLSVSQGQLLSNNQGLNTVFGINHFTFSTAVNAGKHTFVEMPVLAVVPAGLAANEVTLYTKTTAAASEIFMTRDASGVEIQMTGPGTPIASANGYSFLPGGLLIQWGSVNSPVNGTTIT